MIYRKIDKNGYFIEDVVYEPKLDKKGNPIETTPSDLIADEFPKDAGFHKPKWNGSMWVEGDTNAAAAAKKTARYNRLENIFNKKTIGLKKLAIDKPWMTNPEAINNQYRVYEEMYKNALKGLYDTTTNQSIITANETAKAQLAPITLLLNTVRGVIESAIAADDPNADILLDAADAVSLAIADLTPANINAIKQTFGIV